MIATVMPIMRPVLGIVGFPFVQVAGEVHRALRTNDLHNFGRSTPTNQPLFELTPLRSLLQQRNCPAEVSTTLYHNCHFFPFNGTPTRGLR